MATRASSSAVRVEVKRITMVVLQGPLTPWDANDVPEAATGIEAPLADSWSNAILTPVSGNLLTRIFSLDFVGTDTQYDVPPAFDAAYETLQIPL